MGQARDIGLFGSIESHVSPIGCFHQLFSSHPFLKEVRVGYAEFGGTGSVRWEVEYRKTKGSSIHKKLFKITELRVSGVDNGERTKIGDRLRVVCTEAKIIDGGRDGTVIVEITLADKPNQVRLDWGEHLSADVPGTPTRPPDTTTPR
jgi:hypothetical protein